MGDPRKRQVYDSTGIVADDDVETRRDWRDLYNHVTQEDVTQFKSEYQGSEEELRDMKAAYLKAKGNVGKIIDAVFCCEAGDWDRIRERLSPLVDAGVLPRFKAF